MGDVKVGLEGFGKRLEKVFAEEEMRGKSVQDLIGMVTSSEWQGEDKKALDWIQQQMKASYYGYRVSIASRRYDRPFRLQSVAPSESVWRYIKRSPQRDIVVSIAYNIII